MPIFQMGKPIPVQVAVTYSRYWCCSKINADPGGPDTRARSTQARANHFHYWVDSHWTSVTAHPPTILFPIRGQVQNVFRRTLAAFFSRESIWN